VWKTRKFDSCEGNAGEKKFSWEKLVIVSAMFGAAPACSRIAVQVSFFDISDGALHCVRMLSLSNKWDMISTM